VIILPIFLDFKDDDKTECISMEQNFYDIQDKINELRELLIMPDVSEDDINA